MRHYIQGLMRRCDDARHGELSGEEMDMLVEECSGLSNIPIFGREIAQKAASRNWSALLGSLAPVLQVQGDAPSVNVNSVNTNTNTVSLSIGDALAAIDRAPMDDAARNEGKALIANAQNESDKAKRGDKIMKAVAWAADKGIDVAISVIPPLLGLY